MSSLDSEYNKNKFRFSNRVANIETLLMAFNQKKKKMVIFQKKSFDKLVVK